MKNPQSWTLFLALWILCSSIDQSIWKSQVDLEVEKIPYDAQKPVIIIFGLTGSGKSTLLNFLLGNSLLSFEKQSQNKFIVEYSGPEKQRDQWPPILHSKLWNQSLHSKVYSNQQYYYVDIEDTEDKQKQLINQYFVSKIIQKNPQIKIIVTVQSNSLDKSNLQSTAQELNHKYLDCFQHAPSSILFVITKKYYQCGMFKTKSWCYGDQILNFKGYLLQQISEGHQPALKLLLESINNHSVGFFPMPDIFLSVISEFKNKLNSIKSIKQALTLTKCLQDQFEEIQRALDQSAKMKNADLEELQESKNKADDQVIQKVPSDKKYNTQEIISQTVDHKTKQLTNKNLDKSLKLVNKLSEQLKLSVDQKTRVYIDMKMERMEEKMKAYIDKQIERMEEKMKTYMDKQIERMEEQTKNKVYRIVEEVIKGIASNIYENLRKYLFSN